MHLFHGAEYSGKVGITMTLVNAAFSFGNIFIYTITPQINMLVEKRDWLSLDKLFKKRLILSLATYACIWGCFAVFVYFFGDIAFIQKILSRFLVGVLFVMIFNSEMVEQDEDDYWRKAMKSYSQSAPQWKLLRKISAKAEPLKAMPKP